MGLILPQRIKIKWNGTSKQHYLDLGYKYTKHGDMFEVDVEHLSKGSCAIIKVKCDYCENIVGMEWKQYLSLKGNTYCCSERLQHKKKTRDENGNLIFVEIPYRNKEWLYNEYIVKNRKASDIAKECGINKRTLREWISMFKLNNKYQEKSKELTKDILKDLYFNQHKTSEEIGKIYRLSGNTVINIIRSYGFDIPSRSEQIGRAHV